MAAGIENDWKVKIKELDEIEKKIGTALQFAGQSLLELAKDKIMNKSVENPAKDFLKTLEDIEVKLANHIVYLTQISTVHPHEGSDYAIQKDYQLSRQRMEHICQELEQLQRLNNELKAQNFTPATE